MKKNLFYYLKIYDYDVLETICFLKERRRLKNKGFTGDKNNSDEVFKYENFCGNEPIKKQKNVDGTVTFFYTDGNCATTCRYVFESVFSDKKTQEEACKIIHKK